MGAASKRHYLDVYIWVKHVIESCVTEEQIEGARKLTTLFRQSHYSNGDLNYYLRQSIEKKEKEIKHGKKDNKK